MVGWNEGTVNVSPCERLGVCHDYIVTNTWLAMVLGWVSVRVVGGLGRAWLVGTREGLSG